MVEIKTMDIAEFVQLGYLQELNRLFLHLCGLAISVRTDDAGVPVAFDRIWDYRHDHEGIMFAQSHVESNDCKLKKATVLAEARRHIPARVALMGAAIQPIGKPGFAGLDEVTSELLNQKVHNDTDHTTTG